MFSKRERPLHGMMYSLGEITETLKSIAHELKRANDLQQEQKNVFQTGNDSKEHKLDITLDGHEVAETLTTDNRPTMFFGNTEPKNHKKGDIWSRSKGIKFY